MLILGLQKTSLLDYPHHMASIVFTGGCNFRCPYCHNGDLVIHPNECEPYSIDEIMDHLYKRKELLDGVVITGGEPTLQNDLPEFIASIKDIGLLVKLDTNGSNPDMLQVLLRSNLLDYVAMDIKNCKEKYLFTVGLDDTNTDYIERICKSVETLKQCTIDYEFRTTICSELHNISDIESICKWISNAKHYYLQEYKETENVISANFSAPDKETLLSYKAIAEKYIDHVELRGID